jgi:adenylosuccinate synthase
MTGTLHVVVGGQFGSEAKGHVVDWLTRTRSISAVVRVAGPNAGHTAYDPAGQPWALRQVPCAAVSDPNCLLYIAAGSEVDPEVLFDELDRLDAAGFNASHRLTVDRSATVLEPHHRATEGSLVAGIGSTGKGIGAARADRLMRGAMTWEQFCTRPPSPGMPEPRPYPIYANTPELLRGHFDMGDSVVIEGTQGYGLGLHAGYYPFCTSSDCRAVDFMAMAGLSPWAGTGTRSTGIALVSTSSSGATGHHMPPEVAIWPVFRTYPIRVAGNSGPMLTELDWADLAERSGGYIKPERTTVTQKIRRIGEWDPDLAWDALRANGGPGPNLHPVLTFVDYWDPTIAGSTDVREVSDKLWSRIDRAAHDMGQPFEALGTGPASMIQL